MILWMLYDLRMESINLIKFSLLKRAKNYIFAANYQESQKEIATCINKQGAKNDKPILWKKC